MKRLDPILTTFVIILTTFFIIVLTQRNNVRTEKRELIEENEQLKKDNEELSIQLNTPKPIDIWEYSSNFEESDVESNNSTQSYWFVYYQDKSGGNKYNGFIEQTTSYFSRDEFYELVGSNKFLINYKRCSKETFESE